VCSSDLPKPGGWALAALRGNWDIVGSRTVRDRITSRSGYRPESPEAKAAKERRIAEQRREFRRDAEMAEAERRELAGRIAGVDPDEVKRVWSELLLDREFEGIRRKMERANPFLCETPLSMVLARTILDRLEAKPIGAN